MIDPTLQKAKYNAKVIERTQCIRELLDGFYSTKAGNRYFTDENENDNVIINDVIDSGREPVDSDEKEFLYVFFDYAYTQLPEMIYSLRPYDEFEASEDTVQQEYDRILNGGNGHSDYIHVDSFDMCRDCYKWGEQKDENNAIIVSTGYNPINKRVYLLFSFGKQRDEMDDTEKVFMDATLKILKPYRFVKTTKQLKNDEFLHDGFVKYDFWFKMVKNIGHTQQLLEKILNKINRLRDINGFYLIITKLNNGFEKQSDE